MITKYGTIVFSKYKKLSKEVGEENAQKLAFECIRMLEKKEMVGKSSKFNNKQVSEEATHTINILRAEWGI